MSVLIDEKEVQLTKKGTICKRKPKTANVYFTQDTEDAIVEYVKTTDMTMRNKIFNERIDYAFHKLTENIIHTFKFYYTEVDTIPELQHEVVYFLLEKLHLYKPEKGKAFSYFGTIAKRYLILYNNANYKKLKNRATVDEIDNDKTIITDIVNNTDNFRLADEELNFIDAYVGYIDKHLYSFFPKENDAKIADAIMELFRKRENIDIFNKKALYIYIREITDASTPQVTKIIKKLKTHYKNIYNEYHTHGYVRY